MGSMFLAAVSRLSGGSGAQPAAWRPAVVFSPWVVAAHALPGTFPSHLPAGKSVECEPWLGKPGCI
ncbi:hypothetical protein; putative signal peptide; putative PPE family protein [Frankia alni ACN14a]|uniref:Uncharacterized protein n=1 Tax=Frankia alni (strain DSM 45986 / CECT 9034 / ACN14a) TaxID=326424 RepID=Q0RAZ5_FRAAA|nr:hypothetical protein; putative signal peptide; putative PPE family protein [Frankia alni ACN14a]